MIEMSSNPVVVRLLAVWALALCSVASAQPTYRIEPIGIPDLTQARAINNQGAIVGDLSAADEQAILLTEDGRVRKLSRKAGETFGKAVNASNLVIYDALVGSDSHAGLWDAASGHFRELGTLGGAKSSALDLNDAGRVVGSASLPDGRLHAFLSDGTRMRDLGTLGGRNSSASGINEHDQIAGTSQRADGSSHAFVEQDGRMTDLGDLGGGSSTGLDINALGHVTGTSSPSGRKDHDHAFLWDGDRMIDLGTLGGKSSDGWALNRFDEVVGISRLANEEDAVAYLYTGGVMYKLMDLLDASGKDWSFLITAYDINDDGDIVGLGVFQGRQRSYRARRVSN